MRIGRGAFKCVQVASPNPPVQPDVPIPPRRVVKRHPPPLPPRGPAIDPPMIPPIAVGAPVPDAVAAEVLIAVPSSAPDTLETAIAQTYGLRVLQRQPIALLGRRLVRLRVPRGRSTAAVLSSLQSDGRAFGVQRNYLYRAQKSPATKANPGLQYALEKIGADKAWTLASGRGVRVAVIDSGIDGAHPDLKGVIAQAFNAIGDNSAEPDDHGTAVAGLISGRGLVRGLAPDAQLLAVRAFKPGRPDGVRLATSFILLRGLDWAATQRARVFNLSFSGPHDPLLAEAIELLGKRNVLMVAAAGNGGRTAAPAYPAAYDAVIAVTATDPSDRLYEKSNRGTYVALASPGVDILAPVTNGAHGMQSGTSFAAAHISGVLALMLEREPDLSAADAIGFLAGSARDLGPPGRDTMFGAGAVNAYEALEALVGRAGDQAKATRR